MTHGTMKIALTLAAVFALTFTTRAQTAILPERIVAARQGQIINSFKMSLNSEYPGIVEGTIYNIVVFKKYYPQLDYSDLLTALNAYSLENENVALRYKAHLASMYLMNTTAIEIEPVMHPSDHEYIFRQIAQQLETKFLVVK